MSNRFTANTRPIPILVYHQIAAAPAKGSPFRSLYVAPEAFARQMVWLERLGYQGLSMTALEPYLNGHKNGKVAGITFDDGYLNNLSNALPSLTKHGFSSTCYALSGLLGKTNVWDLEAGIAQTALMNEAQLRQWVFAGQEVGSHTRQHIDLTVNDQNKCRLEIALGKNELESIVKTPVQHFCYPYGRYQPEHIGMVDALGFVTATTTQRSRCHPEMDMLQLPRVPILRSTSLPVFWLKIATDYEDRRKK
jgi:peptidoglycan/xylan/chitin deacetylase (PgdA/CDA1 family)